MGELGLVRCGAMVKAHHDQRLAHPQAAGPSLTETSGPLVPDRLWVADFTYVSTWSGWCYTACFVTDAYARRILGWAVATTMTSRLSMLSARRSDPPPSGQRSGH